MQGIVRKTWETKPFSAWELYQINLLDGRTYYGQHLNHKHPYDDGYMGSGVHLRNYYKSKGMEGVKKIVLFAVSTQEKANEKEQILIESARMSGEVILNHTNGGHQQGIIFGEYNPMKRPEIREKMSRIMREKKDVTKGLREYREGLTEEQKKEWGRKISERQKGKDRLSPEARKRQAESLRKYYTTHDVHNKGEKADIETRKKLSESHIGKQRSETSRKKQSETIKNHLKGNAPESLIKYYQTHDVWNKGVKKHETTTH
jgi:hypothetical protein